MEISQPDRSFAGAPVTDTRKENGWMEHQRKINTFRVNCEQVHTVCIWKYMKHKSWMTQMAAFNDIVQEGDRFQ